MKSSLMIQKYEEDFNKLINKFYNSIKNEVSIDKKALQSLFYDSVKEYRTHIFSLIEKSFNPDSLITSDSFNLNDELFYLYKNTLSKKLSEFNIIENREVSIIDNFIKNYIELDSLLLTRYFSSDLQDNSLPSFHESDLSLNEKTLDSITEQELKNYYLKFGLSKESLNKIYLSSYQDMNKSIAIGTQKIDIVFTDPPYFIAINKNWDNKKNPKDRIAYFKDYIRSLVPIIHENSVIMIFNDYSNIDIIQEAMSEIKEEIDYLSNPKNILTKKDLKILDYYKERNLDLLQLTRKEINTLFNFSILGFLEWMKANPASRQGRKGQNPFKVGNYTDSEYLIVGVNNFENNPRKKQFESLNNDSEFEIFGSVNPDSLIRDKDGRIHSTTKNASVLEEIILKYTNYNDIILDNFSGSGAISIACFENRRNFISNEIDNYIYQLSIGRFTMIKKSIGKRTFPLLSFGDYHSNTDRISYSRIYRITERYVHENYYSVIKPLNRKDRIDYVKRNLLDISSNYGLSYIKLNDLTINEFSFILGFLSDYLDLESFNNTFGLNRGKPFELFAAFDSTDYISDYLNKKKDNEIKKQSMKNTSNISSIEAIEKKYDAFIKDSKGHGKFIVDNIMRLYHRDLKELFINVSDIIQLFRGATALANYKNKSSSKKERAFESYAFYLETLFSVLMKYENNAQKALMSRKSVNDQNINKVKLYYKSIFKIIIYLIYLSKKFDDINLEINQYQFFIENYLYVFDESAGNDRFKIVEKLTKELKLKERFDVGVSLTNGLIENAAYEAFIEVIDFFKNPHTFEAFDYKILFPKLTPIIDYDNIFGILLEHPTWNAKTKNGKLAQDIELYLDKMIKEKVSDEVSNELFKYF